MGCTKVSEGCKNCYMFREQKGFGNDPTEIRRSKTKFEDPLKWKDPEMIFVCSWGDFFHEEVPLEWIEEAWSVMARTPHHTYLLLTKRFRNIRGRLPTDWEADSKRWEHVWLGVSVESQEHVHRIDVLLAIPAYRYFVSVEPMLGPVDLKYHLADDMTRMLGYPTLDWVICGGESDHAYPRLPKNEWVTALRDQCVKADVPFFFKQWGGRKQVEFEDKKVWGGRVLEGKVWSEIPDDPREGAIKEGSVKRSDEMRNLRMDL